MTKLHIQRFRVLTAVICLLAASASLATADQRPATAAERARADIGKTIGFVPGFFRVMSDVAVAGAWEEMKGLQLNPASALDGRTKELLGLAVAAQVPCHYCVLAHTEFAKLNGAGDAEIAEAVAVGGVARHWSAYLYGAQVDQAKFQSDVERILTPRRARANATPIVVTDAASALRDIEQTLGFVPDFLRAVTPLALPGAWRELKELRLASSTAITPKHKALIALAVASQVPSEPCVRAETAFAKAAGASEREIGEAIGMAAITRNMSTMLNGQQIDPQAFAADIRRIAEGARAAD